MTHGFLWFLLHCLHSTFLHVPFCIECMYQCFLFFFLFKYVHQCYVCVVLGTGVNVVSHLLFVFDTFLHDVTCNFKEFMVFLMQK